MAFNILANRILNSSGGTVNVGGVRQAPKVVAEQPFSAATLQPRRDSRPFLQHLHPFNSPLTTPIIIIRFLHSYNLWSLNRIFNPLYSFFSRPRESSNTRRFNSRQLPSPRQPARVENCSQFNRVPRS
jgi:hypothetical protein